MAHNRPSGGDKVWFPTNLGSFASSIWDHEGLIMIKHYGKLLHSWLDCAQDVNHVACRGFVLQNFAQGTLNTFNSLL